MTTATAHHSGVTEVDSDQLYRTLPPSASDTVSVYRPDFRVTFGWIVSGTTVWYSRDRTVSSSPSVTVTRTECPSCSVRS